MNEILNQLLQKPVAMMTGEELYYLLENSMSAKTKESAPVAIAKKMFYGMQGIMEIFGCSVATANRIKKSGIIDDAITQIGRKIIIDGEKALALVKANGGFRSLIKEDC